MKRIFATFALVVTVLAGGWMAVQAANACCYDGSACCGLGAECCDE